MNYKTLFFALCALSIFQSVTAQAASIARPSVAGYAGGMYKTSTPSLAANGSSYNISGVTNIAGTAINLAGAIPLAANAAEFALTAARANPAALAGSLLLGYLIANGIGPDPLTGQLSKYVPGTYPNSFSSCAAAGLDTGTCSSYPNLIWTDWGKQPYDDCALVINAGCGAGCTRQGWRCNEAPPPNTYTPATDPDFAGLPNPIPTIAPELPNAPYLPNGVPVDPPLFKPVDIPTASPYNEPNGATVQPRATVTPNPADPGTVQIQTYDLPVTNPDGSPVANPAPVNTTEPPKSSDQCADHPDSLGCSSLDQPSDESLNSKDISASIVPVSVGSAGTCPAPETFSYLGKQFSMSFQPACDSANMLRPLILAISWLFAGMIFVGGVKNG
jgi:hypothetical protein